MPPRPHESPGPLRRRIGRSRSRAWTHFAARAIACLATSAVLWAQDPFAPGLRWSRAASASDAWLPRSVAFAADDNFVWVSALGASSHLELDSASDAAAPLLDRDDALAGAISVLSVAAGKNRDALFSVAQHPQPDATHRRTRVARYGPLAAGAPGGFAPDWTYDPGPIVNGPARIACDERGTKLFVALWNDALGAVRLDVLDGASGALLGTSQLPAANLNDLAVSADGTRAIIGAGLDLYVCDAGANVVHHSLRASSVRGVCVSADGALVGAGGIASFDVLAASGGGYASAFSIIGAGNELVSRAELSRDGSTLAIGWWTYTTGVALRLEAVDVASHARLWQWSQQGPVGGFQNVPEAVRVTADGARIALGTWGDGSATPEVLLFDRSSGTPRFTFDVPGSVLALALDATGTRVAVGVKDAHANQFASTGSIRMYDTGERELCATSQPRTGGVLELSARRAGASDVLFLAGRRSNVPILLPGTIGVLWLRRAPLSVIVVPADASGRADLVLPVANDPLLRGSATHWQAAFRVNGVLHFAAPRLDPIVL